MLYVKTYLQTAQKWLPIMAYIHPPATVFTNSIFDSSPATNCSYVSIAKSSLSFSFFLVAACICNVLIFMYDVVCILRRTSRKMKLLE